MSKGARARKHSAKMARKRAMKAQRRSAYAALAGTSKKTKRVVKHKPGPSIYKHAHIMANCGNPGCKRCYPLLVGPGAFSR